MNYKIKENSSVTDVQDITSEAAGRIFAAVEMLHRFADRSRDEEPDSAGWDFSVAIEALEDVAKELRAVSRVSLQTEVG